MLSDRCNRYICFKFRKFQSLSGNSSVVGECVLAEKKADIVVSIPFREFKCCRLLTGKNGVWFRCEVSIPFREFKCCRNPNVGEAVRAMPFQSLSGNSSVVGTL